MRLLSVDERDMKEEPRVMGSTGRMESVMLLETLGKDIAVAMPPLYISSRCGLTTTGMGASH